MEGHTDITEETIESNFRKMGINPRNSEQSKSRKPEEITKRDACGLRSKTGRQSGVALFGLSWGCACQGLRPLTALYVHR